MRFRPTTIAPAFATLIALLILVGCGAPKELAIVTERAPVTVATPKSSSAETMVEPRRGESPPVAEQVAESAHAGRFDGGKMWTFDHPPVEWFKEAYDFEPGQRWFARARAGALRFSSYCSASFVSPNGLVLTNHHCARQSVTDVSAPGEELLDSGFFSESTDAERLVEDLYVDQLISIADVTVEVLSAEKPGMSEGERVDARQAKAEQLAAERTASASTDSTRIVEVIALYNGAQYSAYTFRRYKDVRLVMAPSLQIGFFGGDHDNFTYPRYNLDFAFFRVYENGEPLATPDHFAWSANGASDGDVVFVVGNPGSTSRLTTVSQLEFERDFALPQQLRVLESRAQILSAFIEEHPVEAEEMDLRNVWFSVENSIKANRGQLDGLQGDSLLLRKQAGEDKLRAALAADSSLRDEYGSLFEDIRGLQATKRAVAAQAGAFTMFSSEVLTSHLIMRALHGYVHDLLKQRGAPEDRLKEMRDGGLAMSDWPAEVERGFIAARLTEMRDYLGEDHPTVASLLRAGSPDSVAARIVRESALIDSTGLANLLEKGYLSSGDASVPLIEAIGSLYFSLGQQLAAFEASEASLNAKLGRAQFSVYGTTVPPDASFSLRIADGVVADYEYNGTVAPVFTTFYGLYDRHHAFPGQEEWALPDRWVGPPTALDLSTPLNLISTNDITGGNSGSPLLNKNLEVVGLVFDGNIEQLPNEYLYRDEAGRTVSVDSRGIIEALDTVYDMDRVVVELRTGELFETEAAADERQ